MQERECGMERCSRPTPNVICNLCNRDLYRDLRSVAWLSRELQITITRRDQLGGPYSDGGHATEKPLVYNAAASEAAFVLRDALKSWAEELASFMGVTFVPLGATHLATFVGPIRLGERHARRNYRPTAPDLAAWLIHHTATIPEMPDAAACADEIGAAVALVGRTIDKRDVPVFCGPCPHCDTGGLFGRRDSDRLHCRGCGARVERADNAVSVYGELKQRFFGAAEMAIIVTNITGREMTSKQVHNYAARRRGQIRSVVDTLGHRLYSAADILSAMGHSDIKVVA